MMLENRLTRYTARIKNGSALLADVKTLFAAWDSTQNSEANFETFKNKNIFGKTSRYRLNEVLNVFRQRYFVDPEVGRMLVSLAQHDAPTQWLDTLLYFFAAQSDYTLRDAMVEVLYNRKQAGYIDLPVIVIQNALREWLTQGKMSTAWSDYTIKRVGRGIMATLRDFGVLEGKANKHITAMYLPLQSFALIAFWLMQKLKSGKLVLHSDEWRLFFLDVPGVERLFFEAHQEGMLTYYAAGSVVRLEFPATSLEEYASGFLERAR